MRDESYITFGRLLIFAFALFRLAYAGAFPLVADESYYWQWSRYPAAGYHDHPPMIAWLITLATTWLGHSETAVRLPAVLSHTVAVAYLFAMAARWAGARAAFYTVVLAQSILGFNAAGIISTPDSPLLAGWAGAAYHVARAYENDRVRHWVLGGLWFGFGLLGKTTMVLFPPLVFAAGLMDSHARRRLSSIRPYAGLLLGALVFLPVILWNADNGWSTFRHAAHQGGVDRAGIHLNYLIDFLASQAGLISPLVFLLLAAAWLHPAAKKSDAGIRITRYLWISSFPVVVLFTLLSLHTRVEGNWAAPGYLTAVVLLAARVDGLRRSHSPGGRPPLSSRLWPWAVGSSYVISGLVFLHILWPVLPLPARLDRVAQETAGWKDLGLRIDALRRSMPNPEKTFIFGVKYQTASQLAFYAPGNPRTVALNRWTRPNAYDYWWDDGDLAGWDAVGVGSASPKTTRRLEQVFAVVSQPEQLAVQRKPSPFFSGKADPPVATYFLYRAYGFKGGLHWQPADETDVRAVQP